MQPRNALRGGAVNHPIGLVRRLAALVAFAEYEPVNFFSDGLTWVDIDAMSVKCSYSLIELGVRQTREEGIGT